MHLIKSINKEVQLGLFVYSKLCYYICIHWLFLKSKCLITWTKAPTCFLLSFQPICRKFFASISNRVAISRLYHTYLVGQWTLLAAFWVTKWLKAVRWVAQMCEKYSIQSVSCLNVLYKLIWKIVAQHRYRTRSVKKRILPSIIWVKPRFNKSTIL